MNYGRDWYYENPRNGYQDWHNRYFEFVRTGGSPPSALSKGDSNWWKYQVAGVPVLGGFLRADDNLRYLNDYLKYHQMTWADVKYPARTVGAGGFAGAIADTARTFTHGSLLRRMYR